MKFKEYNKNQGICLPPYLEELIPENDVSRIVDSFVDTLPMSLLTKWFIENKATNRGPAPYHPKMILKVLIYAYIRNIYSCREIEKALQENIKFMWLSGSQKPDFRTINRFRGVYFKDILEEVFTHLVLMLGQQGFINSDRFFIDGTKILADSNKHKVVWKKNVDRYKDKINKRVKKMLEEINSIDKKEMELYGNPELPDPEEDKEFSSEELADTSRKLEKCLEVDGKSSKTETGKKLRKVKTTLKHDAEKMSKYEQQEKDLHDRKSMSKTDKDASVMKTKRDELRPAYNPQVATNNSFIVGNHVSQNASDGFAFIPLIKRMESSGIGQPGEIIADAGYGYVENFDYLDQNGITALLRYPSYYVESSNAKKYQYHYSKFKYDEKDDTFICPMGNKLECYDEIEKYSKTGYRSVIHKYKTTSCLSCPVKSDCTKSKTGRHLEVNHKLKAFRTKARNQMKSAHGRKVYKQRGYEVETVFGEMKRNKMFERFHLRGLSKVSAEFDLMCISFNLHKLFLLLGASFFIFIWHLVHFIENVSDSRQYYLSFQSN